MGAVAFDLLIGRYGAEYNLCKLSPVERTICDAPATVRDTLNMICQFLAHPTTSKGFLTIAMERWVRSYTSRAM